MCSIKLPTEIKQQIDKYRGHCLWRGGDINAKNPPLAAWKMVTKPKTKVGLGVIRLSLQNDVLLMKNLLKFYKKEDLLWVQLWNKYYSSGKLPGANKKGSFWRKNVQKLLTQYKCIAQAQLGQGDTILFWQDKWNGKNLKLSYPELFSFATNAEITVKSVLQAEAFEDNFHLPLSVEAYDRFCELEIYMQSLQQSNDKDKWTYIWGSQDYSSVKAYKHLIGAQRVHLVYRMLWKSSDQLKHKVFFWLLLKNRLNTRGLLRRKRMQLESYACEMCI
jgi:hypothetical protein